VLFLKYVVEDTFVGGMIKPRPIPLFFFAFASVVACRQDLDRAEYINWVQDYENGLHAKKTFSEFIFDIQYQPTSYVALLNENTPTAQSSTLEHYILRIALAEPTMDVVSYSANSQSEKQERLYYFSYLFQHDIYLEVEGKRIPCVLFHSEPTDLKKVRTFVLGFESGEGNVSPGEVTFVIDSPKFSSLPIRVKILQQDIPKLKI